ncbi:MAG: hypothetical protein IH996_06660 [Proteobacteria bacterium]|nr:hypothetical protein [Pseudomonadota bacterium]
MKKIDVSKLLFYSLLVITVTGFIFGFGLYSGAQRTGVYLVVRDFTVAIANAVRLTTEEASTLTKTYPKHFLHPSRYHGSGVTLNDMSYDQEDFILLSGFFEKNNELRLIKRNGIIVRRWPVRFSEIFPDTGHIQDRDPPATDWNIYTHGALALPDGSVVFNFDYGGLVKLDRCGDLTWSLARQTHHSIEAAEGGGFWVPGRRFIPETADSPFPPFITPISEDTILRISEDGQVLDEISVPKLFYDNDIEAVLTSTGHSILDRMRWDKEIVHLNKIDELSGALAADFPMFETGDLALSFRNLNLVLVVDPETKLIKWWRIGPWLRQHDPEFKEGGKLVVFNNNLYLNSDPTGLKNSNILEIDPSNGKHKILYGDKFGESLFSTTRGKVELTRDEGLLITEPDGGRVLEVDAAGRMIWEYINRYNAKMVLEITEARVYAADYFDVTEWSDCR